MLYLLSYIGRQLLLWPKLLPKYARNTWKRFLLVPIPEIPEWQATAFFVTDTVYLSHHHLKVLPGKLILCSQYYKTAAAPETHEGSFCPQYLPFQWPLLDVQGRSTIRDSNTPTHLVSPKHVMIRSVPPFDCAKTFQSSNIYFGYTLYNIMYTYWVWLKKDSF